MKYLPLTNEDLVKSFPSLGEYRRYIFLPLLNTYCTQYGIDGDDLINFLATISHESCDLSELEEDLHYSAKRLTEVFPNYFKSEQLAQVYANNPQMIANKIYANRLGNGDEQSGDGWMYRGRGLIQITGKDNYRNVGIEIGVDLLNEPAQLVTPEIAVKASCYWYRKNVMDKM